MQGRSKPGSTSQEVMVKMNKKAYHFKKKGNEAQFIFNSTVEDHIDAAKKILGKVAPNSDADKAALEKATTELDQRPSGSGRNTSASRTIQTFFFLREKAQNTATIQTTLQLNYKHN